MVRYIHYRTELYSNFLVIFQPFERVPFYGCCYLQATGLFSLYVNTHRKYWCYCIKVVSLTSVTGKPFFNGAVDQTISSRLALRLLHIGQHEVISIRTSLKFLSL